MSLTEAFYRFTELGAEWVMWLLLALSVISVAIMVERAIVFARRRERDDGLAQLAAEKLAAGQTDALIETLRARRSFESAVLRAGLERRADGADAAAEAMLGAQARERLALDRNLTFLGTVGANAPFIGLAGTVLGIIQAFRGLGENVQAAARTETMTAIAEALVATFIGLVVAIPAVVAFNYFQRRMKKMSSEAQIVAHVLLAHLHAAHERALAPEK